MSDTNNIKSLLYSLNNNINYKHKLGIPVNYLLLKYNSLIIEYLTFITENIKLKNKFIIIRGFETISHVFNIILYYSKNIELAFHHGQKSFYYYVEYISQITDEDNICLNLNSRDASLFVYKKTIYDIKKEFVKNKENESDTDLDKFNILNINYKIIKKIIYHLNETTKPIIENINKLFLKINNNKLNKNLDKIENFINYISISTINNEKLLTIIDLFISKYNKNKNLFLENINETEFNYKLLNETPEIFISWIFTN